MEEESVDHLLIHCAMASEIWAFFLNHLRVSWSFPNHFCELILGWWINDLEGLPSIIWSTLPSAICWGLWKERNAWIFEGVRKNLVELALSIYRSLFNWLSVRADFDEKDWDSIWCEEL